MKIIRDFKLKVCPFCRADNPDLIESELTLPFSNVVEYRYHVECRVPLCGGKSSRGLYGYATAKEAADGWNRRLKPIPEKPKLKLLEYPKVDTEMACRECGCTHFNPCDPPCGWAEPGLCTACAGEDE